MFLVATILEYKKLKEFGKKKLKEFDKKLKDLEKTQGYEALSGLVGLKKVYKNKPGILLCAMV